MLPALEWVGELYASFSRATEIGSGYSVEDTVNPLVKRVVFNLSEPLGGENYRPFQTLAHAFAKANGCLLERIHHEPCRLVLVVGVSRRFGPPRRKNPLLGGDKGRPPTRG